MKLKSILTIFYWVLLLFVAFMAGSLILSRFDTPIKYRLFAVQSGSMEPSIRLGSVVVVVPQESYAKDDVITFRSERSAKETNTHRIVEVLEDKDLNRLEYRTKGDANEDPDHEPIPLRRVVGKVVFAIPYLGYPISFAQTQTGLIVLVVIPTTLIAYSEFLTIKNELALLIKRRQEKRVIKERPGLSELSESNLKKKAQPKAKPKKKAEAKRKKPKAGKSRGS